MTPPGRPKGSYPSTECDGTPVSSGAGERHRQLVETFWHTANERDWERFTALLHPQLLYTVPQTRERARGRAAFVEVFRTWPGAWRADVKLLIADAQRAVSTIDFVLGGEIETGITFFEFDGGLVSQVTDYWPSPYDPPARATPAMERF